MNLRITDALLKPKSVALVGATEREGSVGRALLSNLASGFRGKIFPVNLKASSVLGIRAYPKVSDIPEDVDLVVLAVPAPGIPEILEASAKRGTKAALVISAGFRETGEAGRAAEQKLINIAEKYGVALVGPNCLGLINTDPEVGLNATFAKRIPRRGNISFLSQSGALGICALEFAASREIGFAHFVSLGNKAVLHENHFLKAFAEDPRTRVILAYLEDFHEPGEFLELAAGIAGGPDPKPIVLLKAGRGKSGRRAAASHTGALAEKSEFLGDLCEQYGVVTVSTIEEMFETALCLAHQPIPSGRRLAILTNAGGPGILASDQAEKNNLEVAEPSPVLRKNLSEVLPKSAGLGNPIDVLGDADASRYRSAIGQLVNSGEADAVLAIATPQMMTDMESVAKVLAEAAPKARAEGVALLAGFARFGERGEVEKILESADIPNFPFAENAVNALGRAARLSHWRSRHRGLSSEKIKNPGLIRQVIDAALQKKQTVLGEVESLAVMDALGIPVARYRVVRAGEKIADVAGGMAFPLAAKIISPEITHKFDAGGVVVGIRDLSELETACAGIFKNVALKNPSARIEGILIQEMVRGGIEFLMGGSRDPHFGALLVFGLGGTLVEAIHDVRFRRVPLEPADADEMIHGIRGSALLGSFRGMPPRDTSALASCLLRLSLLFSEFPEIVEADLNPIFALERGALAADARIVLRIN